MICRSIDPYLKQSTIENIGAYRMVTDIIRKSTEKGVVVNYDHHSKSNQCEHPQQDSNYFIENYTELKEKEIYDLQNYLKQHNKVNKKK